MFRICFFSWMFCGSLQAVIDPVVLEMQRQDILRVETKGEPITPYRDFCPSGSLEMQNAGKRLIAEGQVGCLVVAGGQGTRLQCTGPKGLFPVTVVKEKSLFQLLAEKVVAAGVQAGRKLPIALMTSASNHEDTVHYFEQNGYFGLDQNQIIFFSQEELPCLDKNGNLIWEGPTKIATGPDGNAASLKHFVEKGIWSKWHQQGIRYVVYLHIDNPLADPFDAELVGCHPADCVMKCIGRNDPKEKVGVVVQKNGKVHVVEYSEIAPEERDAREGDGSLSHICANISLFSFKMDFIQAVATNYYDQLPFHKAWKAVKYLHPDGVVKMADKPMAWKFEKFIFDILPFAETVKTLVAPRELCFAPLKSAEGPDGIEDVKKALLHFDRITFEQITGIMPSPSTPFELAPQFYYPTEEILLNWKGVALHENSYIEP